MRVNDESHQLVTHFYVRNKQIKNIKTQQGGRWVFKVNDCPYHSILTFQFFSHFDPNHGVVVVQPVKLFPKIAR